MHHLDWSLESRGIKSMTEIPSCISTSHPTKYYLCSASGFYSPDRLTHPISVPGILQRFIHTALSPKDTVYCHIHDPGFLAYIPTMQSGSLCSHCLQLQRKCVTICEHNLKLSQTFNYKSPFIIITLVKH